MTYDIGKRIRAAREASCMSAKDLAEKIDVSPTRLSNWETGVNRPMADHIVQIADALGVSTDTLLGVANDAPSSEIISIQRAMKKLTPEDQKRFVGLAKMMFEDAFDDGNDEIDV